MKVCAECKFCVRDTANRRLCCLKHVDHVTGFPEFCRDVRFDGRCHDGEGWEAREEGSRVTTNPEVPNIVPVRDYESGWPAVVIILGSIALGFILGWWLV